MIQRAVLLDVMGNRDGQRGRIAIDSGPRGTISALGSVRHLGKTAKDEDQEGGDKLKKLNIPRSHLLAVLPFLVDRGWFRCFLDN